MNESWNKLFSIELLSFMKKMDEEEDLILQFFTELQTNMYSTIKNLAKSWHTYEEDRQVGIAIFYVGEFHASRFCIFMDYLSMKHQRGEMVI